MKFKGTPNLLVNISRPEHSEPSHIQFDANGIYETEIESLSARLANHFEVVRESAYKCKKCDFSTDDKAVLMRHYRTEHKEN